MIIIAQEINKVYSSFAVRPQVNVATDRSRVDALNTATLTCTVTRANPEVYRYRWFHEGSLLPHERTSNLTGIGIVGIYACEVANSVGFAKDSIFIHLRGKRITM